jgi:pyruvate ferredoxin oxidoreductase alpha subunit
MSAAQEKKFLTGNEMAAEAARAIDFHFMGFYPITPSTEIAQLVDGMRARGEVSTVLLAADGEHGAAGACFGASTAGARVLNATSANGFLYSLEQLPVQAGTRLPMVLHLVTRSVSGPLDIRCDHSDLMFALQTGWLILLASTPQAVYDLTILGLKLAEHPEVRLPVMVVSDGFFTSHQRQAVEIFRERAVVQEFLGPRQDPCTSLNPAEPVTFGPYMNDPDLINNKVQLHRAHEAAARLFPALAAEFERLSGRAYPALESIGPNDAEAGLFLLNSAAETAREPHARLCARQEKLRLLRPNLLRPFPTEELQLATRGLRALVIGERSDTPGSSGGPLSHEVRSALFSDHHCEVTAVSRVFGLGGKDFREEDAEALLELGLAAARSPSSVPAFGFLGAHAGEKGRLPPRVLEPVAREAWAPGLVKVTEMAAGKSRLKVEIADLAELALKPKRIAPGHGACPGCGIFPGLDQFFKGIEGDVVVLYHTGCAMVVTTDYPFSAHRVTYLHNLFQNGAPTLSGLVETFREKKRRGEIAASEHITFIMITGDGGMDIGMGPTIGTALRNHPMIVLEYDNQGYMNTGGQLSYTTPLGKETSTSHVGPESHGKHFHHKDTAAIMAATGIPYVFTAIEGLGTDLIAKAARAQWHARHSGFAFGKILVSCPLNWAAEESKGREILQLAADTCFFPLYEVEQGLTTLSYDPEAEGRKLPVREWLSQMGKTRHLLKPGHEETLGRLQEEVDRRWARLKARASHPLL